MTDAAFRKWVQSATENETTRERLLTFDSVFLETVAHTNLVARSSLADRAERHYADSMQLDRFLPDEGAVLDIGSGAGFPGIVLAILAADTRPGLHFTLCDSVKKKAAFLRIAAETVGLQNVTISDQRAEAFHVKPPWADVVMARAVTALPGLIGLAHPLLRPGGLCIFPKGEKADIELTAAQQAWSFKAESVRSTTHPEAKILLLSDVTPKSDA